MQVKKKTFQFILNMNFFYSFNFISQKIRVHKNFFKMFIVFYLYIVISIIHKFNVCRKKNRTFGFISSFFPSVYIYIICFTLYIDWNVLKRVILSKKQINSPKKYTYKYILVLNNLLKTAMYRFQMMYMIVSYVSQFILCPMTVQNILYLTSIDNMSSCILLMFFSKIMLCLRVLNLKKKDVILVKFGHVTWTDQI